MRLKIRRTQMSKLKKVMAASMLFLATACSSRYHTVKQGDTLYSIAVKNNVSVNEIMHLNDMSSPKITVGQRLVMKGEGSSSSSSARSTYHTVKKGETLYRIAVRYGKSVDQLKSYNNLSDNNINVGQRIYLVSGMAPKETVNNTPRTSSPTLRSFRAPLKSMTITSKYGTRVHPVTGKRTTHHGVDLRAPMNTPVYAPYAGVVTYSGWMSGYGKIVIIDHGGGYTTRYGHLNRWMVNKGTKVRKGQLIAKTGNTGISTGPHLHYEIRKNGNSLNPASTF